MDSYKLKSKGLYPDEEKQIPDEIRKFIDKNCSPSEPYEPPSSFDDCRSIKDYIVFKEIKRQESIREQKMFNSVCKFGILGMFLSFLFDRHKEN